MKVKLSDSFRSKLQLRLSVIVIIAFGLALLASTTAVMVPITELGRIAIEHRLHDEQTIIEQRVIDWRNRLQMSSRLISQQIELSNASLSDRSSAQDVLNLAVPTLILDMVWVMDANSTIVGRFVGEPPRAAPEFSTITQGWELSREQAMGTRLVVTDQSYLLLAFAPVRDIDQQFAGHVVVGSVIDHELLGEINFYRTNVALGLFASDRDIPGVSANEPEGIAHLNPAETEVLRLPQEMQERVRRGESVYLFDVGLRGTPHAIIYNSLPVSDETSLYYAIAVDENESRAIQNIILSISLGTIFLVTLVIGTLVSESLRQAVIHPLKLLSESAKRLGAGQLTARVTSQRTDEIGQLYTVFNTMADAIQRRTGELDSLNSVLEARVRERTLQVESQAAWLESIFCQAQEALIVTDRSGNVRLINAVALSLLNMQEADVLGSSLKQILEHASKQPFTLPDSGTKVQGELEMGGRHYQYSVVALSLDQPTNIAGYVSVLVDVTALRRLSALQTQVIRLASHDLRSPITSLGLQLHMLRRKAGLLSESEGTAIAQMQDTINTMRDMIANLLNVERIEQQVLGFSEMINLATLVTLALSHFETQFSEKRQTIVVELPNQLPLVCGDPVRILEVLRNFLSNAHKYTPAGGQITLKVFASESDLCVEVSDSGIGIDEEDLAHVFEARFRAKTALSGAEEGQGIGLSLVKSIIDEHGGQVWVSSQIGRGSTFGFLIPTIQSLPNTPV